MAQGAYELVEQGGTVRDPDGRTVVLQATGQTTAISAGTTTDTVIKATPGVLLNVLVLTTGSAAVSIYDNATTHTGTVIGTVPSAAAIGTVYQFGMPAAAGITLKGASGNPALTVSWL